jgi:L-methionine (R)-S-oxide reductase
MAETLNVNKEASKSEIYQEILPQITSLIEHEENLIANLSNITAVLTEAFGHWWTGFYLRDGKTLVLGPFQGPLACTRIPVEPVPRGVCNAARRRRNKKPSLFPMSINSPVISRVVRHPNPRLLCHWS